MEVIDVFPKDVHAVIEFSSEEIRGILNFLEKAISLYAKVHSDGSAEQSDSVIEEFESQLKSVLKVIEKESN